MTPFLSHQTTVPTPPLGSHGGRARARARSQAGVTSYNICDEKMVLRLRNVRCTTSDHAHELRVPHGKLIIYPQGDDDDDGRFFHADDDPPSSMPTSETAMATGGMHAPPKRRGRQGRAQKRPPPT